MVHTMNCVVVLFATFVGLGCTSEMKRYEIFTATDKTKWIQVSQLEQIFSSIEESLRELNEKQKRDNSVMTQLTSNIQSISIRLQGIEEQLTRIERAETYSKVQLQQFADSSIKEEVQLDLISQRLEKNRQQFNQRLNDVDSNLEILLKSQDIMEKEIRKMNVVQNTLTDNVDELSQHTKQQSSKILQNITNAQQELHQKLKDSIKLSPGQEGKVRILTASDLGKNGTNQTKFGQNDDSPTEWSASLVNFDTKLTGIKNQAQSMEMNLQECTEVVNKIYNKLDTKKDDLELFLKDQFSSLLDQMKQQYRHDLNKVEGIFKENFDNMVKEQVSFKETCHRLQINELQMEDKAVEILEKLFNYLDNKTYELQHDIQNLAIRAAKSNENHSLPNFHWNSTKIMEKVGEILKPVQTTANSTQRDSPYVLPPVAVNKIYVANKLDGTNEQAVRSRHRQQKNSLMQREWLPNEGPEKVYLADEPQRLPMEPSESVSERQPILVAEKLKALHRPQQIEMNLSPEHFYGIEGLSRSKRSASPLT